MVLGCTWSVRGGPGWFLVILGQYRALLVGTWWYWVSRRRCWLIFGGAGSVCGGIGWYRVVLGQYNLVLLSIKWNFVSTRLLCLNILKKVLIWSDVTIAGRTDEQTNERTRKDRATQPMDHERLR